MAYVCCDQCTNPLLPSDDGAPDGVVCSKCLVDRQVRAMRSIVENVRGSFQNYVDAVKTSDELRSRLIKNAPEELAGAFELIVRRAYAVIESAERVAKGNTDGPQTETKEPS